MQYIGYIFFRFIVFIVSLIPFSVFYKISDGLAFLLHRVLKYRYAVVKENIENSFPEKSEEEIVEIIRKFYFNLSDILLEGIKAFTMSREEILKRYKFNNTEVADAYYEKGIHVIAYESHFTNWEWGVLSIAISLKHRMVGFAKPIKNPYVFKYTQDNRGKFGNAALVSIWETRKSIRGKQNIPSLFLFASDQTPSNVNKAQWITFLNQDTPCLYGADRIARQTGFPAIHLAIDRVKRGYYEVDVSLLCENPTETKDGEITEMYMRRLEKRIIEQPHKWLWSHKRWKHSHRKAETIAWTKEHGLPK